jgi:hypothetical protein
MEAEQRHQDEDSSEQTHRAEGQTKMTRREALSIVGKHAVYTAPAVLAVLAVTKTKSAHADEISF